MRRHKEEQDLVMVRPFGGLLAGCGMEITMWLGSWYECLLIAWWCSGLAALPAGACQPSCFGALQSLRRVVLPLAAVPCTVLAAGSPSQDCRCSSLKACSAPSTVAASRA